MFGLDYLSPYRKQSQTFFFFFPPPPPPPKKRQLPLLGTAACVGSLSHPCITFWSPGQLDFLFLKMFYLSCDSPRTNAAPRDPASPLPGEGTFFRAYKYPHFRWMFPELRKRSHLWRTGTVFRQQRTAPLNCNYKPHVYATLYLPHPRCREQSVRVSGNSLLLICKFDCRCSLHSRSLPPWWFICLHAGEDGRPT